MGATEQIAKWVVTTNYEDIPPDAIRVANESCFDLLGVILAGSAQPVGEIIQKYVEDQGAPGRRRSSPQELKAPCRTRPWPMAPWDTL